MENMLHRTVTLTCTDSADDIPLNPDGTLPTPAQKSLDILTNTTTKAVVNWETNTWELLTTRHAPFGMPLSEQHGENWWMAADTSAVEEESMERTMADLADDAERARLEVLDRMIEESMDEAEIRFESLRQAVALEFEVHRLVDDDDYDYDYDDDEEEEEKEEKEEEMEMEEVSEWIPRRGDQPGRWRRTLRPARDSGVDCEL